VTARRGVARRVAALHALLACTLLATCAVHPRARDSQAALVSPSIVHTPEIRLEYLGMAVLSGRLRYRNTPVGGLSGIRYDAPLDSYLAVSDDPSDRGPARVYRLEIDGTGGGLTAHDLRLTDMIPLRRADGSTFAPDTIDPEGIAVAADGSFYVSSEGNVGRGIGPSVRHFAADGALLGALPIPDRFMPNPTHSRGIRQNTGFEALTLTPDGGKLIVGTESALIQDGPFSSLDRDSPARILVFDLPAGHEVTEHIYPVDRVRRHPATAGGLAVKGLTELLAIDDSHALALERSYVAGRGNSVDLYAIDLSAADDVSAVNSLQVEATPPRPVTKRRLLNFSSLGVRVDNLEGMTFGPDLPDGRKLLVIISDNNFNWVGQITEFLTFAVDIGPHVKD
jgi:hypothetical protein